MIDCREAVTRMWAYLSRDLESDDVQELEHHLGVCQRCCGELEFSRELRTRVAGAGAQRIPPALRSRVEEILESDNPQSAGQR